MAFSKDHHPNGVRKTRRVPRSEAGFRQASGYVAAIDFGTTYCSVAYALQREKEIIKLPLDGPLTRVPNAILIERKSNTVIAFGYGAQNQFAQLPKGQQKDYIYFERMKMILYRKQEVNRNTPVSPINSDEQFYLVDVVAFILLYLKDRLYGFLNMTDLKMSQVEFDWVVTVPAIWDARGKQMMREAAYKAGLCSSPPSCKLVPCSDSTKRDRPVEKAPHRLSLALEPEAAGLSCYKRGDGSEDYCKPRHFTVVDIGGGTVDITSYRIDDEDRICMVGKPDGNDWGGTQVNEQFAKFFETIVGDSGFKRYVSESQQHKADLNKLLYGEFERQKVIFGSEEDYKFPIVLNLPNSLVKYYKLEKLEAGIKKHCRDVVDLDGSELTIKPRKVMEFFQPAIEPICQIAFEALERIKTEVKKLEAIYLVGGFGGCKLLKKFVQERMQAKYGPELKVFVPIDHKLAIACGAIIFRRNPEIIWSRKVEATYGDVVASPFDPDIHNPAYKILDEGGGYYCNNLFRPFTEIGDTIHANEILQNSITPAYSNQTEMHFIIYQSNKRDIWYAKDTAGKIVPELTKIGTLDFDLRDIPGRSRDDKEVIFTIDVSQTEIQLKAHHEKTGKEVKVVLDTLSQYIPSTSNIVRLCI